MFRASLIIAAFVTILSTSASEAFAERRLALVVGNSDYKVGPLRNPVNDANLMSEALSTAGFEVTYVTNVTENELERAIADFSRTIKEAGDDTVGLFYYAGHAVQSEGENYLIPVDAHISDALDLRIQTVSAKTVMAGLTAAGNSFNIVILDACRNNPFSSMSRSGSRGLARIDAPKGTLIAYSTAPGNVALDGVGNNSPYTKALAKIVSKSDEPIELAFKLVRNEVIERTNGKQVPWESSSLTGDFYFNKKQIKQTKDSDTDTSAKATGAGSTDIEYWKSVSLSNDPELFSAYLEKFPTGIFADLAKKRIASLAQASNNPTSPHDGNWRATILIDKRFSSYGLDICQSLYNKKTWPVVVRNGHFVLKIGNKLPVLVSGKFTSATELSAEVAVWAAKLASTTPYKEVITEFDVEAENDKFFMPFKSSTACNGRIVLARE